MTTPAEQLGRRLRGRRLALGLTQHALGKLAGISGSYVGHVERGEYVFTTRVRIRLAAALRLNDRQGMCFAKLAARAEVHPACRKGTPEWRARISVANRGIRRSPATEFKPGHQPRTKGLKGIRLSPATEFQPGCLRGQAARKYRRVGWITQRSGKPRRGRAGRKGKPHNFIKVCDSAPPAKRWVPLARHIWEQQYGPVPDGCIVVHRNGDTLDDRLDNLILIERRHLLAHQRALDPAIAARRRKGLIRSSRQRWDTWRKLTEHRRRLTA